MEIKTDGVDFVVSRAPAPKNDNDGRQKADREAAAHHRASLWLNNGVPATEVARLLGHDVAVLLKIYANCIDGQEEAINDRITAALTAGQDRETLPPAPAVDTAAQPNPRTRAPAR